jgi:hypothetical protein
VDPNAAFKAIADYGITVVALVAVSALVLWLIRDLRAQRDRALDGWSAQIAATDKLTNAFNELADLVKDRRDR